MRKYNQRMKLFIVLILCTAYVFNFTHFGAQAFQLVDSKNKQYSTGTTIASVNIAGKTKEEATELISGKIAEWKKNTAIKLKVSGEEIAVDSGQIQFHLNESLNKIVDGTENDLSVSFDINELTTDLSTVHSSINLADFDTSKLNARIVNLASTLKTGNYSFAIEDYFLSSNENVILGQSVINPQEVPADLIQSINAIPSIEIKGQTQFSFLDFLKEQKLQTISSESMSIIASGIYQAILTTNFNVIEKNTGSAVPVNIPIGFEAKVDLQKNMDFIFDNPNKNNYLFALQWLSDGLHVTLSGTEFFNRYQINAKDIQYFSPKIIKQFSPLLQTGQHKVERNGEKGVLIKVYREEYQNDKLIQKQLISEDFYPPVPRIEIHSLTENKKVEEVDLEQFNDDSKEEEVEQEQTVETENAKESSSEKTSEENEK